MTDYQTRVLNKLLDQYESGKNISNIRVTPKMIIRNWDDRYMDVIKREKLLSDMCDLKRLGLVDVDVDRLTGYLLRVQVAPGKIDECFSAVNRRKKAELAEEDRNFILSLSPETDLAKKYVNGLWENVSDGKKIDHALCEKLTRLLDFLYKNNSDILERELSQMFFRDTKEIEKKYRWTITEILCDNDPACDEIRKSLTSRDAINIDVMESYGVSRAPSFCYIKGNGSVRLLDGRKMVIYPDFPVAVTSDMLSMIQSIKLKDSSVVTVENLTAFARIRPSDEAVVYLGGYHNRVKQHLLTRIREDNPSIKDWRHSGDLDPDGLRILFVLRDKTGIDFKSMLMESRLLDDYMDFTKPLEKEDVKLAVNLQKRGEETALLEKMLATGRKLEQEIVFFDRFA